jgi:hypothetical protein
MTKHREQDDRERERDRGVDRADNVPQDERDAPNPPRTTTGPMTAPKFGSAGSGGAELEPGPERD